MRRLLPLLAVSLCALLAGCAPKLIPGTETRSTPDTREILDLMGKYRSALEGKNVDGILKLVSKSFFENSGTAEGGDDYDYAGLESKLRAWAERTKVVRAVLELKNIYVEGDRARAQYFFDVNYQIPGPDETLQWKRDSDTKEMNFVREGGVWRIVSGI